MIYFIILPFVILWWFVRRLWDIATFPIADYFMLCIMFYSAIKEETGIEIRMIAEACNTFSIDKLCDLALSLQDNRDNELTEEFFMQVCMLLLLKRP